jgi:hypothetical protein
MQASAISGSSKDWNSGAGGGHLTSMNQRSSLLRNTLNSVNDPVGGWSRYSDIAIVFFRGSGGTNRSVVSTQGYPPGMK